MKMVRTLALATLGVVAWRAWQRRRAVAAVPRALPDPGKATPPHGDPLARRILDEEDAVPYSAGAQFSRGFGGA